MEAIEILKSNKIKVTTQRVKVLEYLLEFKEHPTAEKVYSAISNKKEILSLATVYNTLTLFVEKGILKKNNGPDDKAVFDITVKDHFHFYCNNCKKVFDISSEFLNIGSMDLKGNKAESFHGYFIGMCNECNKGVKKSKLLNMLKQKVRIFNRR